MTTDNTEYWSITPKALFELINEKRRLHSKTPIDHGTISTRLILKCNIVCPGKIDPAAPEIRLTTQTIPILEQMLNEQFDLYMKNELVRHCKHYRPHREPKPEEPLSVQADAPKPDAAATGTGVMGRIKRLFKH